MSVHIRAYSHVVVVSWFLPLLGCVHEPKWCLQSGVLSDVLLVLFCLAVTRKSRPMLLRSSMRCSWRRRRRSDRCVSTAHFLQACDKRNSVSLRVFLCNYPVACFWLLSALNSHLCFCLCACCTQEKPQNLMEVPVSVSTTCGSLCCPPLPHPWILSLPLLLVMYLSFSELFSLPRDTFPVYCCCSNKCDLQIILFPFFPIQEMANIFVQKHLRSIILNVSIGVRPRIYTELKGSHSKNVYPGIPAPCAGLQVLTYPHNLFLFPIPWRQLDPLAVSTLLVPISTP